MPFLSAFCCAVVRMRRRLHASLSYRDVTFCNVLLTSSGFAVESLQIVTSVTTSCKVGKSINFQTLNSVTYRRSLTPDSNAQLVHDSREISLFDNEIFLSLEILSEPPSSSFHSLSPTSIARCRAAEKITQICMFFVDGGKSIDADRRQGV